MLNSQLPVDLQRVLSAVLVIGQLGSGFPASPLSYLSGHLLLYSPSVAPSVIGGAWYPILSVADEISLLP